MSLSISQLLSHSFQLKERSFPSFALEHRKKRKTKKKSKRRMWYSEKQSNDLFSASLTTNYGTHTKICWNNFFLEKQDYLCLVIALNTADASCSHYRHIREGAGINIVLAWWVHTVWALLDQTITPWSLLFFLFLSRPYVSMFDVWMFLCINICVCVWGGGACVFKRVPACPYLE